uniref:Translocation protein SEC62 n=1 Tax=Ditylenchus dipsaci TaxID=166011 RepID=A0A915CYU6_9BILA
MKPSFRNRINEAAPTKLTKEEDAIARFIRFNCPDNSTMFEGNEVHYFSGKKAVDLLVESKKYGAKAKAPKFNNNYEAEDFLQSLLERGLFFRAKKVVLKKKDKSVLDEKKKGSGSNMKELTKSPKPKHDSPKPKPGKGKEKADPKPVAENADEEADAEEAKEEDNKAGEHDKQEEEKKKKKKIQAMCMSGSSTHIVLQKMIGVLIIFGTIAGCLFPLWPDWLRLGIYYLSVTGIACFGVLIGLALARSILFCIIWACTVGRHKLWVLPNLTEDCGFFESFKPFYTYEYVPGGFFGDSTANKRNTNAPSTSSADANKLKKSENENSPLISKEKAQKRKTKDSQKSPESEKKRGKGRHKQSTDESEPEEQLVNEESSDQDLAEEDENHPSDEQTEDSDPGTSNSKTDEEDVLNPSPRVRRRRHDNKKQTIKEESPAAGDDDFVIVDSNE